MKNDYDKNRLRQEEKEVEWIHVLQFLKVNEHVKFGEEPDFVSDFSGAKIGIEHTRLLMDRTRKGSPLKAKENYQTEIIQTAFKLYCSSAHQPLYVTVNFDDHIILKRQNVDSVAQQFCLAIKEIEALEGIFDQQNYLDSWQFNLYLKNKIPKEVAGLWIEQGIRNDELWSVSGGGIINSLSADVVQECINSKEGKVEKYRENCAEVWLLIVATGSGFSSMFDSEDEAFAQEIYSSSFDKIFLLDAFHNRVYPLNIRTN